MRCTRACSHFTQRAEYYLIILLITFCFSLRAYASKGLALPVKDVCYSPPRRSRTIVALSSSNKLRRTTCCFPFASPSFSSTPMKKTRRPAPLHRSPVRSYISFCSPRTKSSTPNLSGSIRGWASPAALPSIVYLSFRKRPRQRLLPSIPNQNLLTGTL